MPKAFKIFLPFFLLLALGSIAYATTETPGSGQQVSGWRTGIADYAHAPSFLIAVDKEEQLVRVFERKSPLTKVAEYVCTTGQKHGDKLIEGDLKTPEGVYFVTSYINSGLNYTLYGKEAYPLNYPNPVDRLRKKTGYGIWIHGKGIPLVPYDSNGCVGMNNNDIAEFKSKPLVGQPVTLALDIDYSPEGAEAKAATAALLAGKVQNWATAWSNRSAEMFDFYNPDAYSIAQREPFKNFKAQKEHIFKTVSWIKVSVNDIQVLEGPGYWVTWFNQGYEASNLKTYGTRRLYWQADDNGELRIVGMEWLPRFKSPVLYADASGAPGTAATDAGGQGATAAPENKKPVAAVEPVTPQVVPATSQDTGIKEKEQDEIEQMLAREGLEFIDGWKKAWLGRNVKAYSDCYSANAIQGNRKGRDQIKGHKQELWSRVYIRNLELNNIQVSTTNSGLKATMEQRYADSRGYSDSGIKTLHLEFDKGWRIVREDWRAN